MQINRDGDNRVSSIEADLNLDNKDFKKTAKITWLADTAKARMTLTFCVYFDHLISKPVLGKEEDFKQFVGHETWKEVEVLGDPELRKLKKGDIIQVQRKGFFKVERAYETATPYTFRVQPVVLFHVPDGSSKGSSIPGAAPKVTTVLTIIFSVLPFSNMVFFGFRSYQVQV